MIRRCRGLGGGEEGGGEEGGTSKRFLWHRRFSGNQCRASIAREGVGVVGQTVFWDSGPASQQVRKSVETANWGAGNSFGAGGV